MLSALGTSATFVIVFVAVVITLLLLSASSASSSRSGLSLVLPTIAASLCHVRPQVHRDVRPRVLVTLVIALVVLVAFLLACVIAPADLFLLMLGVAFDVVAPVPFVSAPALAESGPRRAPTRAVGI